MRDQRENFQVILNQIRELSASHAALGATCSEVNTSGKKRIYVRTRKPADYSYITNKDNIVYQFSNSQEEIKRTDT